MRAQVSLSGTTTWSTTLSRGTAVVKMLMLASACTRSPSRIGTASVVVRYGLVRGSRVA
jgi:hypothetical protein